VEGVDVVEIGKAGRGTYAIQGFGAPICEDMRFVALKVGAKTGDVNVDVVEQCKILIDVESGRCG